MFHHEETTPVRPQQTPSIASVTTIRADPFIDQRYGQPQDAQSSPGLFFGSASSSHAPPIPPARTSSLHAEHAINHDAPSANLRSPSSRRVPSVQVIHPTPTKKKARPRSTASGDTATAGSPSRRPTSRASVIDPDEAEGSDQEEAKKARAREKGRDRQRRKRERDKQAKIARDKQESANRRASSSNLTPSHSMSVPSSVSSTYSSLPHTQSMYSISPNTSFAISTSSTSLSGQSSPKNVFSPAVPTDIVWAGKSRRRSGARPPVHLKVEDPPSKRRKSEPEPEDFRHGLGVTVPLNQEGGETIRQRPKPRRTISAFTETSTASVMDTDLSEWGARSPTPPPVALPPAESAVTSQGQFFASTIIQACTVSGLAEVLHAQLKLGQSELAGLREDLGAVYDKWAKGALEKDMGKVTLEENIKAPSTTPQRPRADTNSDPPGSPLQVAHTRTRSLSSASMLARGLNITTIPGPPAHTSSTVNKWDSPAMHGPGSDSPTHSNLQTPSTGQGTSFVIPNHEPVNTATGNQTQAHWRSHTDPTSGYDYRQTWRPVNGGLESPLTVIKSGSRPGTAAPESTGGKVSNQNQASGSNITPPQPRPAVPQSASTSTPITNISHHQPHYAYTQMPHRPQLPPLHTHQYQTYPHTIAQPNFTAHPYNTVPWTPTAMSRPGQYHGQMPMHPFTPPTPMPLKGNGGEQPMYYHPSFLSQHQNAMMNGTPQNMVLMGGPILGMGENMVQQPIVMQTPTKGTADGADVKMGNEQGAMVLG